MDTSDWLLVVGSVVLGQFALLGIEIVRGQLERKQRRGDRRDDFARQALIDLQDALDDLLRLSHEAHAFHQRKQRVPEDLSREHRVTQGRVRRLSSRVEDAQVRADVGEVLRGIGTAIHQAYVREPGDRDYPFASEYTLLTLDEPLGRLYDRTGELLRDA